MNKKGFTLIELLIVIAIIGILSGILISVINPAEQRTKANQAVARSNLEKICLAKISCLNSSITGVNADCDSVTELGVTAPGGPTGATYSYLGVANPTVVMSGCTYTCNLLTGVVSATSGGNSCRVK